MGSESLKPCPNSSYFCFELEDEDRSPRLPVPAATHAAYCHTFPHDGLWLSEPISPNKRLAHKCLPWSWCLIPRTGKKKLGHMLWCPLERVEQAHQQSEGTIWHFDRPPASPVTKNGVITLVHCLLVVFDRIFLFCLSCLCAYIIIIMGHGRSNYWMRIFALIREIVVKHFGFFWQMQGT